MKGVLTMLLGVLYGLNIIAKLALAGLLVFLCFRTRSKGLMLISAILFTSGIFNSIFDQVIEFYMDRWIASEMDGDGARNMTAGDFLIRVSLIKYLLYECLCLLGGFLIYRDWQQGKFKQPSAEIQ